MVYQKLSDSVDWGCDELDGASVDFFQNYLL